MQYSFKNILLVSAVLAVSATPSFAEDKKTEAAKEKNPITELEAATNNLMKDMDDNQLLQFRAIEQSYRTIKAVEDVQASVTRAVESCTKENPELKEEMSSRLRSWRDTIRPTMKEAYKKLDKMVLLQSFTRPSVVRNFLKMFDEAIVYRNMGIKAVPVTEKESCLKLKKSMDKSEKTLSDLLTQTLSLEVPLKTKKPADSEPVEQ
ncbi:MAG: hypothetical protein RBR86_04845 [Pseudobdellovibrionaceae bacterium]|jgi:hypothetical protein|nr:hypothetical protein [Pseudobdellovibrionaceae bacterium]